MAIGLSPLGLAPIGGEAITSFPVIVVIEPATSTVTGNSFITNARTVQEISAGTFNTQAQVFDINNARNQVDLPATFVNTGQDFTAFSAKIISPASLGFVGQSFNINVSKVIEPAILSTNGLSFSITHNTNLVVSPATYNTIGQDFAANNRVTATIQPATFNSVAQTFKIDALRNISPATFTNTPLDFLYGVLRRVIIEPATYGLIGNTFNTNNEVTVVVANASSGFNPNDVNFDLNKNITPSTLNVLGGDFVLVLDGIRNIEPANFAVEGQLINLGSISVSILPATSSFTANDFAVDFVVIPDLIFNIYGANSMSCTSNNNDLCATQGYDKTFSFRYISNNLAVDLTGAQIRFECTLDVLDQDAIIVDPTSGRFEITVLGADTLLIQARRVKYSMVYYNQAGVGSGRELFTGSLNVLPREA